MEETQVPINRRVGKKAVVHKYNGMLFSHKKESYPLQWHAWMDLEDTLNEISQSEKDKYHMNSLICGIQRTE